MQPSLQPPGGGAHFEWVDSVRGIAILWIVFFHCLLAYGANLPWPITFSTYGAFVEQCAPTSAIGKLSCPIEAVLTGILQRGAQGVGVFILFSGFGLAYSLFRHKDHDPDWGKWYRRRITRLFPIYWLAHLIVLVSPIQYKPDPIDYRFILSFLGDRIIPIDKLFFYMNPSWWFFGLLLQLYIAFPFLFRMLRRFGPAKFMAFCITAGCVSRYVLFAAELDGRWLMGGFFAARLWEFAAGMSLGKLLAENPDATVKRLFSGKLLILGIIMYVAGQYCYRPDFFLIFSDGLIAIGLMLIMIHIAINVDRVPGLGKALITTGVYSYSIYLLHQPFVMYAGEQLQSYHIALFFIAAAVIIAVISLVSMCFEHAVNRLIAKFSV